MTPRQKPKTLEFPALVDALLQPGGAVPAAADHAVLVWQASCLREPVDEDGAVARFVGQ